jgi:hypothetical protein
MDESLEMEVRERTGHSCEQCKRGEGVPIAWTPEEIHQATVETLVLIPE